MSIKITLTICNYNDYQTLENYKETTREHYLKYLHEKAHYYSMTKGKKHPDTINAIRTLQEKRAMTSEGIIIETQNII